MNGLLVINALVAVIVGVITAVVSWRVLRDAMGVRNPVLGIVVGTLAGLGLASPGGGNMSVLLIPYEALGIAVVALFFLAPLFKGKSGKGMKPMQQDEYGMEDDPWEKELRRGGKRAARLRARKKN